MAGAAALLLALAPVLPQQAGEPPFTCVLPAGQPAFAPAPDGSEAWSSTSEAGGRFLVQRHLLESPGARADLVARTLRDTVWRPATAGLADVSFSTWSGDWGGVPAAAGHVVRFAVKQRPMAALERLAVLHDVLVQFTWEGPAERLAAAETCAESFRIPDAWIPAPPPTSDAHRGVAPDSAAQPLPWRLDARVDLIAWGERKVLEVEVEAAALAPGVVLPPPSAWRMPPDAVPLPSARGRKYRLDPQGEANGLLRWGVATSERGDLAACDATWLAAPDPGPGSWLPPAWSLTIDHSGFQSVLGPQPPAPTLDADGRRAVTRFELEAGQSWPFFVAGRYQKRQQAGVVWHLRLDTETRTPDEAVAALARLEGAVAAWLPASAARWSLASFPGAGDRVLPGLYLLDETRGWFDQPADGRLEDLSRRTWLARMVSAQRFGQRLRGSGSGAPAMEVALAEFAAARLLESAGWEEEAAALRNRWNAAEGAAGPLPVPLTLLPREEALGAGRLLTRGALAWTALEALVGRESLDARLAAALAARQPWSTQDLIAGLPEAARARAEAILYGTDPL